MHWTMILIIAIVTILAICEIVKEHKQRKWQQQRAKQSTELRYILHEYGYDVYATVECDCGYETCNEMRYSQKVKPRRYYENNICPNCGREWKTSDYAWEYDNGKLVAINYQPWKW